MKRFALVLICFLVFGCTSTKKGLNAEYIITPSDFSSMSPSEVESALVKGHPGNYFTQASKVFSEGDFQKGVMWFYVGQIRFRAYLKANPSLKASEDPALFASLIHTVGPTMNGYIGGNVDEWIMTIDEAIKWHNEHPDKFLDKEENKDIYASVISGLEKLKRHVDESRDLIREKRLENGLDNRS
ncbi:hypothetical protein [Pseudodesulfovibrio sp. zrk46]|uniref:hypothetical protein n=1 Tax=Pseudodesulfovibrio sp. zrk46 TaxID=2725288 RepID=UPI001449B730|nr:hypothetical protein [Pseudodesulfovibrio sp. zrk46]QJB55501.1 hypothetical protein HFN16_03430 [Pseudodesulfovibrio sp. zrk46]